MNKEIINKYNNYIKEWNNNYSYKCVGFTINTNEKDNNFIKNIKTVLFTKILHLNKK